MGLLFLLLYHHRCRPYLEGDDPWIRAAHHCRIDSLLSRPLALGRSGDGSFHRAPDIEQPHPDELLFRLRDALHRAGLRHCRTHTKQVGACARCYPAAHQLPQVAGGHCHLCGRRNGGLIGQCAQPLPYLRLCQVDHARTGRAHPHSDSGPTGCGEAHQHWPRLRLYHTMELRRGRNPHPADSRLQRRRLAGEYADHAGR